MMIVLSPLPIFLRGKDIPVIHSRLLHSFSQFVPTEIDIFLNFNYPISLQHNEYLTFTVFQYYHRFLKFINL